MSVAYDQEKSSHDADQSVSNLDLIYEIMHCQFLLALFLMGYNQHLEGGENGKFQLSIMSVCCKIHLYAITVCIVSCQPLYELNLKLATS